jgi:hypothetical protein
MTPTAETMTNHHKLTPARQNEILSQCQWTPEGKVRVTCSHRTEPLLRVAGVSHPRPLAHYSLNVRRDRSGFLVIDHDAHQATVRPDDDDDALYAPGGLLEGMSPETAPQTPSAPRTIPVGFFEEIRETLRIRRFEIPVADNIRIRVEVLAYDDKSLPSPIEREQWISRPATDAEFIAAISALYMARETQTYEK